MKLDVKTALSIKMQGNDVVSKLVSQTDIYSVYLLHVKANGISFAPAFLYKSQSVLILLHLLSKPTPCAAVGGFATLRGRSVPLTVLR